MKLLAQYLFFSALGFFAGFTFSNSRKSKPQENLLDGVMIAPDKPLDKTKTQMVKDYLLSNGSIDVPTTFSLCETKRLSSIILYLRKYGMNIECIKNGDGKPCTYKYIPAS